MAIVSAWTKHLKDTPDKEKFISSLQGSQTVFKRLNEILDEIEKDLDSTETDADYSSPSWAYLQADKNGFRRCLKKIRTLTNLDQKDK